jgi:hypothetical protein
MDFKNDIPQTQTEAPSTETSNPQDHVLQVNFSWRKNTILVTEPGNDTPRYVARMSPWTMKSVFRTGTSAAQILNAETEAKIQDLDFAPEDIFGTSRVSAFKIDCEANVRGRDVRVSAAKRLVTRYNYPSMAYSDDPAKPAIMTWKSNSKWKFLDMDLKDENDQLVARFNPRYFGMRKVAAIEMFGPKAWDQKAIEEIIVTGLTLYVCMVYRSSSWVPLIGAMVARPGKDYKVTEQQAREEHEKNLAVGADEFLDTDANKYEHPDSVWDRIDGGATGKDVAAH